MANPSDESQPGNEKEEQEGGPVKTFLEHLEDLRWTLICCVASLVVGMGVCLAASPTIIKLLTYPLEASDANVKLQWLSPMGGFLASMQIAFWGGITLSLPFILYFVSRFVVPALKRNEKVYFTRAFVIGAGLFFAGVLICYFFVLRVSLFGVAKFNAWLGVPTQIWRAEDYFQFIVLFMVGMGVSFEMPVVLLTLVRMGIVPHEWMVKGRKYFFVANLAVCSFITPDYISTFFMVIPVQLLMEICILISKHWERQKRSAEAALAVRETGPEPATRH